MLKILVVDDELDMQLLFEQRFRKEIRENIVQFSYANSGEEALKFLAQYSQEAVLILSDINMQGMSGLELLNLIKLNNTYIPPPVVMMITAYGDSDNYRLAMELGADDFLTKPIDFSVLKKKLNILPNV